MSSIAEKILLVMLFAFLLNLPLGYLRSFEKKFYLKWFVYVHASIPLIIALRRFLGITIKFAPLFIIFAVFGQMLGGKIAPIIHKGGKYGKDKAYPRRKTNSS